MSRSLGPWYIALPFLLSLAMVAQAQLSDTLWTSWVPLAVHSPYLSSWMNATDVLFGSGVGRAPEIWPVFWNGAILGWAGHIRIDNNVTWKWLGDAGVPEALNSSILNNIQITSTRTVMSITSGPIDLNITYLSPIEPSDPAKQSFPFTYVSLTAASNDGQPHEVQVYSDISGEWVSGNRDDVMTWQTVPTDTILYHQVSLATPDGFSEVADQAEDTTVYFAALRAPEMTWMADRDATCRGQFSNVGKLTDASNSGPKAISKHFNVFAISADLGNVTNTTTDPVVWAVGMLRDPAIQSVTAVGAPDVRSPYWRTEGVAQDLITSFLQDYNNAVERAEALDNALAKNASAISPHLVDLVSIAARQAMAGTELTVGGIAGSFNTSDVKMFMKDIGSSGRVNPVEVLYASFPFFLSVNASYGAWLLKPVLDYASSLGWTQPYAPRDIGLNYPNATGNPAAHTEGVEQSGNMLIMTLAHARATGDGSLISTYYPLLKRWADYLVNNTSPVPANQVTADDGVRPNSTNLAIKGIIAIGAMSQMSAAMGQQQDVQRYSNIAQAYANTWKSVALASDKHVLSNFGDPSTSWALEYNLYADKWLRTNLLDDSVYSSETTFVQSLLSSNQTALPIDSDSGANGNTAWTLFTAMTMTDDSVRNSLIDTIWNVASQNKSQTIFPTVFALDGTGIFGAAVDNSASPAVGAMLAPLAVSIPNMTISISPPRGGSGPGQSPDPPSSASKHSKVGPIVGGVVGGVGGFILALIIGFFLWHKVGHSDVEKYETGGDTQRLTQPTSYYHAPEDTLPRDALPDTGARSEPQPPVIGYLPQTTKLLEAMRQHQQQIPISTQGANSSHTLTFSDEQPADPSLRNEVGSVSPSEVHGLRREVQALRRAMRNFGAGTMAPPPTYHSENS